MSTTDTVAIRRGRYSAHFQVARAMLSAASAVVNSTPKKAVSFIDDAIAELDVLKGQLIGGSK